MTREEFINVYKYLKGEGGACALRGWARLFSVALGNRTREQKLTGRKFLLRNNFTVQ